MIDLVPKIPGNGYTDDGVPKVALMFLLTRGLPHEPLWRMFFEAAASLRFKSSPPVEPDQPLSDILPPGRCRPNGVLPAMTAFEGF